MSKVSKKDIGAILHDDGVSFRVWAPFAAAVAVTGSFNNWSHATMASEGDGYWFVDIAKAEAGQEYKFVIYDGYNDRYKNDPRSLQVTTSAGNSVIVDTTFKWHDDGFKADSFNQLVIYELHVGTFNRPDPATSGSFQSAAEKLDHLAELGINAIELMPIGAMSMDRGWGYATDFIYAVESLYGGRRGFLEFVDAAHQRGIAVILDVVYNHFGPDNGLDLWQFDGWNQDSKGGIYFYNDWRASTPWGDTRPDYGRNEVRQYILDNVRLWMQASHLDGLRVDSTIFIRNVKGWNNYPQEDLSEGWSLLQAINTLAQKINPGALLIAEDTSGNDYITKSTGEGGAGFSTQWEVTFPSVMRSALDAVHDRDRNLTAICNALTQRYNNDAFQRIVYTDSHDTAGNNGGARLSEEISPGNVSNVYARKRSLLAAALILTAPAMPMLFQGQEFMEDGSFNDWQALDWSKTDRFAGILQAFQHMIALRKNQHGTTKGLVSQWFNVLHLNDSDKVMAYHRWDEGGPGDDVVVVFNFANTVHEDYIINFPRDGVWKVRFDSDYKGYSPDFKGLEVGDVTVENGSGHLALGPYAVLILSQDKPT